MTGLLNAGMIRLFVFVVVGVVVATLMFAALVARAQDATVTMRRTALVQWRSSVRRAQRVTGVEISLEGVDAGDFTIEGGGAEVQEQPRLRESDGQDAR